MVIMSMKDKCVPNSLQFVTPEFVICKAGPAFTLEIFMFADTNQ